MNPKSTSGTNSPSPWGFLVRYSLSHRTSVVVMVAVGFGLSLVTQLAIHGYRSHKESLLGEFLTQKAKVIEARLQAHLLERSGSVRRAADQWDAEFGKSELLPLTRQDELIVFKRNGSVYVAGWDSPDEIWLRDLDGFRQFWEGGEEFSFITDSSGTVLGSNKEFVEGANADAAFKKTPQMFSLVERELPQIAFGEDLGFSQSAAVRLPVKGTNLVLYSETGVSGYLRVLRKLSGGMLSAFVFVAFFSFAFAGFAATRLSAGLNAVVMRYQALERGSDVPSLSPPLSELSFLNEKLSLVAMKMRARFIENSKSASIKEDLLALLDFMPTASTAQEFLVHGANSMAKLLAEECLSPSLTLYFFANPSHDDASQEVKSKIFKKMFLMLSGIPVAEPSLRDVGNEGWSVEDAWNFCGRHQSELVSESEVRFPVVCGEDRIGFLLCSGKGVNTLSRMKLEWLMLMSDVIALGYAYLKAENPVQYPVSA
ncbi:MAG: hypothetical protein RIR26_768 [Pseudomonadota bacterium]|jgi:hypothetical protein